MGESRLIYMANIKQPTLYGSIASRQYKLYDWLNNCSVKNLGVDCRKPLFGLRFLF
jgi:hypothetical protein